MAIAFFAFKKLFLIFCKKVLTSYFVNTIMYIQTRRTKDMSKYGDYLKQRKESDLDFFFGKGNWQWKTNKYLSFTRVLDDDNIIIMTSNIKVIKGNLVMCVDNNKVIYLKSWQVKEASNWYLGIDGYLVKLNRKYFKPYTFKNDFEDMAFEKENTFDDLLEDAKAQDELNMTVKLGPMIKERW